MSSGGGGTLAELHLEVREAQLGRPFLAAARTLPRRPEGPAGGGGTETRLARSAALWATVPHCSGWREEGGLASEEGTDGPSLVLHGAVEVPEEDGDAPEPLERRALRRRVPRRRRRRPRQLVPLRGRGAQGKAASCVKGDRHILIAPAEVTATTAFDEPGPSTVSLCALAQIWGFGSRLHTTDSHCCALAAVSQGWRGMGEDRPGPHPPPQAHLRGPGVVAAGLGLGGGAQVQAGEGPVGGRLLIRVPPTLRQPQAAPARASMDRHRGRGGGILFGEGGRCVKYIKIQGHPTSLQCLIPPPTTHTPGLVGQDGVVQGPHPLLGVP